MSTFYAIYPPVSGGTIINPSIGTNGAPAPTSSTEVGGINPSGNLQPLQTDASGNLLVSLAAEPVNPFNVNLSAVGGAAISEGQKLMAASLPVVIASDQSTLPVSAASLPLPVGASTSALQTTGNTTLTSIKNNQTNGTQTTGVISTVPIPDANANSSITGAGAVTAPCPGYSTAGVIISGTWTGTIVLEGSVDGTNFTSLTGAILGTGALASSFTANASFQASISGLTTIRLRGNTVATGTATVMIELNATAGAVVISDSLPNGTNTIGNVGITGTVPLPTGSATAANQTNGSQKTQVVDGSGNVISSTANALDVNIKSATTLATTTNLTQVNGSTINLSQQTMANSFPVVIASNQTAVPVSGTVAVTQSTSPWVENVSQFGGSNVVTGTGASGAGIPRVTVSNDSNVIVSQATAASLNATVVQGTAANLNATVVQGTAANLKASVNLNDGSGSSVVKGQTTSAGSLPVVIASDQSAISTAQKGLAVANAPVQNVYSSTNITTAAYTQLIASTTSAATYVDIFDSSGQAMILAVGGAGSEVIQAYIAPGGDSFYLVIPAGSRVAYKALTNTANSGYLLLNLRG